MYVKHKLDSTSIESTPQHSNQSSHPLVQSVKPKAHNYEDDDCLTLLQRLTNYFISNSDTITFIYYNSGKDYNDFGRF